MPPTITIEEGEVKVANPAAADFQNESFAFNLWKEDHILLLQDKLSTDTANNVANPSSPEELLTTWNNLDEITKQRWETEATEFQFTREQELRKLNRKGKLILRDDFCATYIEQILSTVSRKLWKGNEIAMGRTVQELRHGKWKKLDRTLKAAWEVKGRRLLEECIQELKDEMTVRDPYQQQVPALMSLNVTLPIVANRTAPPVNVSVPPKVPPRPYAVPMVQRNPFVAAAPPLTVQVPSNENQVKPKPKPVEHKRTLVENSAYPFVPCLTHKPGSEEDFVPQQIKKDNTKLLSYEHPFNAEIKNWKPNKAQLAKIVNPIKPKPLNIDTADVDRGLLYVDSVDTLDTMLKYLRRAESIAVDLEHHSEHSFLGYTCLLQISTRTDDFIIDWLPLKMKLECLNEIFTKPDILKVFHGCNSDILWLQRDCGIYVVGCFDTYFAARKLNLKEKGLSYLLGKYCNIEITKKMKKSFQLEDWRLRPLPEKMLCYARQDTHYLLYIADMMRNKLIELGIDKLKAVYEESKQICLEKFEMPVCNLQTEALLKKVEKSGKLNTIQTNVFKELSKWRDLKARELDESISCIMPNYTLEAISVELLDKKMDILEFWKNKFSNEFVDEVQTIVQQAMEEMQVLDTNVPLSKTAFILWKKEQQAQSNSNTKSKTAAAASNKDLELRWNMMGLPEKKVWRYKAREFLVEQEKRKNTSQHNLKNGRPVKKRNDFGHREEEEEVVSISESEPNSEEQEDDKENPIGNGTSVASSSRSTTPSSSSTSVSAATTRNADANSLVSSMSSLTLYNNGNDNFGFENANTFFNSNLVNQHQQQLQCVFDVTVNFKDIPTFPCTEELLSHKSNFVRKNVINGPYINLEHYMDVHLRLLREDFIRPLKEGLQKYRNGNLNGLKSIKIHSDISLYEKMIDKKTKRPTGTWLLQLPYKLLGTILSSDSKRFIPGSLLLFSNNNFNTIYFGCILNGKNDEFVMEGRFPVKFNGDVPPWRLRDKFIVVECENYFEPYRRVMDALKTNKLEKCSLVKYLTDQQKQFGTTILMPAYLRNTTTTGLKIANDFMVNPYASKSWPSASEIGMDPAQYDAYKAALTKEMTVIQGPPGTGKTYLGVQIVKALIDNKQIWKANNGGPIIIACYTNHALDQFMESILDCYTPEEYRNPDKSSSNSYIVKDPKIVRIGGGSKSERIQDFQAALMAKSKSKSKQKYPQLKITGDHADIIFITTTGFAKRIPEITAAKCHIMIIEEAAEIFESHISAMFTPHLQHLILLGDHQQLRPICASNTLSNNSYNLDVSLFERLVLNNFKRYILNVQHRMRPEIRSLISGGIIYNNLNDSKTVQKYPNVYGMDKNLYFITHNQPESQNIGSFSKYNSYEAEYLVKLCEYLILEGYDSKQIVILATYMSQVNLIQTMLNQHVICKNVAVETADSYQGEENDIVLLSLVRSNDKNEIGFMKTDNRTCVALSRAKIGLYIIGNIELLARNRITWDKIYGKLDRKQQIGCNLKLVVCTKHGLKVTVKKPEYFSKVLNGGCMRCLENI